MGSFLGALEDRRLAGREHAVLEVLVERVLALAIAVLDHDGRVVVAEVLDVVLVLAKKLLLEVLQLQQGALLGSAWVTLATVYCAVEGVDLRRFRVLLPSRDRLELPRFSEPTSHGRLQLLLSKMRQLRLVLLHQLELVSHHIPVEGLLATWVGRPLLLADLQR